MTYLDTHVVAYLYAGQFDLLSEHARLEIEANTLRISPMVILELEFLREIGRISEGGEPIVNDLEMRINLRVCEIPFTSVVRQGLQEIWTRDPFDRLIVAQARLGNASNLLTKDRSIRQNCSFASW